MTYLTTGFASPFRALALLLSIVALPAGCGPRCPKEVSGVDSLKVPAAVPCPSMEQAQDYYADLGHTVVSAATVKVDYEIRQICWYRATGPAPTHKCLDHKWTPDDGLDQVADPYSRSYYQAVAADRSALSGSWGWEFDRPSLISCDPGGGLYGDIKTLGERPDCPADPPPPTEMNLVLSGLVGADQVPEVLSCSYKVTFVVDLCGSAGNPIGLI